MIVEINLYVSFYVVLYKYFKYLGLAMISFNFFKISFAIAQFEDCILYCYVEVFDICIDKKK